MDIALLHHDPDRAERYRDIGDCRRFSSPDRVAVVDPALIDHIFRSDGFEVVNYAAHYRAVSARTGIDFSGMIDAFEHIPLAQEGEAHRKLRSEMARLFGAVSADARAHLAGEIDRIVEGRFRPGADVELVGDLATPIFDAIYAMLLGVARDQICPAIASSQVFDGMMSLRRRKRLDAALRDMSAALVAERAQLKASPGVAVALNILGQDALVGSLALSLWRDLRRNDGMRLADVAFSATFPMTSVAYIDRVATRDMAVGPLSVAKDEIVRLYLDATTIETLGQDAGVTFGKGRHACLGKPISLAAWKLVTEALGRHALRVRCGEIEIRSGDYVFLYPNSAVVHLDG